MTLWTVACQAPLFMGFSRQEYWSGLLCPSPEDLPDPGIELASLTSPALIEGFPGNSAGKKDPPAMQETLVRFLGWEDLLEKG